VGTAHHSGLVGGAHPTAYGLNALKSPQNGIISVWHYRFTAEMIADSPIGVNINMVAKNLGL
jgi:hypothetical protein